MNTLHIEPVPPPRFVEAVHFLCGGTSHSMEAAARFDNIYSFLMARPASDIHLWRVRRDKRSLAVAASVMTPGRTALLLHSRPDCPGVDASCLAPLMEVVSSRSLDDGATLVQSLLESGDASSIPFLTKAGFSMLANLLYMRKGLSGKDVTVPAAQEQYAWLKYGDYDETELGLVILETYRQSLDCPGLAGLRRIDDIIAGHRACGQFSPQAWWIALHAGRPAGCILVNDFPQASAADVVYLGVIPDHRGRGLSRTMLLRASLAAQRRGMDDLTLAVDSSNTYAIRSYERAGMVPNGHRLAYAVLAGARRDHGIAQSGM